MTDFVVNQSVTVPSGTYSKSKTYSAALGLTLTEAAAGSGTTEINLELDVSAVKGFLIASSVPATIKTNDVDTPDNTLVLKADKAYIWDTDAYDSFKFTTDITSIFVVVAGATAAQIRIEAIVDPTP